MWLKVYLFVQGRNKEGVWQMGNVGVAADEGLGSTVISFRFFPASSPPPSLISEYVVEEAKEGDFVSTGIHTFLHDCTFLARNLSLRAEAGKVGPLGIKRQKSTWRQETTQRNKVLVDKELI